MDAKASRKVRKALVTTLASPILCENLFVFLEAARRATAVYEKLQTHNPSIGMLIHVLADRTPAVVWRIGG